VGYTVVTGRIHIERCASGMVAEEIEWFERVFSCAKFPEWGRLAGKVIDLEEERYEPHEDST
jgi:hypothetical protein